MMLLIRRPPNDPQLGLGGRARIVFGTGRREFVHTWTAKSENVCRSTHSLLGELRLVEWGFPLG